jgi:hypothetical protein
MVKWNKSPTLFSFLLQERWCIDHQIKGNTIQSTGFPKQAQETGSDDIDRAMMPE